MGCGCSLDCLSREDGDLASGYRKTDGVVYATVPVASKRDAGAYCRGCDLGGGTAGEGGGA